MVSPIDIVITINEIDAAEHKNMGYMAKTFRGGALSIIDQVEVLIRSIAKEWFFQNEIFVMHSLPISDEAAERITKAGARLLCREVGIDGFKEVENRITGIRADLPTDNNFRLILDADMIAVGNPKLEHDHLDAMAGFTGYNFLPHESWQYISGLCGTRMPVGLCMAPPASPWIEYALRWKTYFFPVFNAGALLVRNDFARHIAEKIIDYMLLVRSSELPPFVRGQYGYTIASSLAIVQHTKHWGLFPPGFNFLASMLSPDDYAGNVYLYHYLSKEKSELSDLYGKYFDVLKEGSIANA